ncbi:hypothetical protein FIBSPDRAFT_963101 [Athelia psychrophila]|uniref:P-loop containing nucleoside triphosphate hydrolase protein n=1 Tax=Athelia psychrophila TaxID=1759441 RepID=A0A165ZEA8_9AGAM|nr:hypothetical protein FIBSPDRAFT_963101 [Fibularhizoctonia sp. CBS 109695]
MSQASERSPWVTIATGSDISQKEQLRKLAQRVGKSPNPPIEELGAALQTHLCAKAPPINKPDPSVQDKRAVELALCAFDVVTCTDFQKHFIRDIAELDLCFLKLWPGIWRWLQFLDDECCQRDRYGHLLKTQALMAIIWTVANMASSITLRREVTSTPGVIAMITRYWIDTGRYPDAEMAFVAVGSPQPFTTTLNLLLDPLDLALQSQISASNGLPELIATAGSAEVVATHAIEHLNTVLAEEPPHFNTIYHHICLMKVFSSHASSKLVIVMLDQGASPLMVKTLLWLTEQSATGFAEERFLRCVEMCFRALAEAMMAINGRLWACQSVDAGMLPAILKSAPLLAQSPEIVCRVCSTLLFNMLCQYLVYRSVVRSAAKAIRRVERLKLDDSLGGPIWDAWTVFKRLSQERIQISQERIALKEDPSKANATFCSRLNCLASIDPDELLRCSGCWQTFYCDSACQRMDWKAHKSECRETQQLLRDGIQVAMSPADSKFIGDIVEKDIRRNNDSSLEKLLMALKASPTKRRTPSEFFFCADYTTVPVNIKVIPVTDVHDDDLWDALADRALQSDVKLMIRSQGEQYDNADAWSSRRRGTDLILNKTISSINSSINFSSRSPTLTTTEGMVNSLALPPLLAVASAVLVALHLLFLSEASTPAAVFAFDFVQLAGCLALLGISIVVVLKEGYRDDLYLSMTFAYAAALALISTLGKSKSKTVASTHLVSLLLATFVVYVYRDVWPLATFTKTPEDASEGPLLWVKISLLGITSVVIPLVKPRLYVPADPLNLASAPNAEQTASILSFAFYSFLDPIIYLANQLSHLSYDQLPPLADYDEAHNLANKSFPTLDPLLNRKKRHIFWGLFSFYRYEFAGQALAMVIQVFANISTPIALNELLKYIEDSAEKSVVRPWVWIGVLFLAPTVASLATQWSEFLGTRTLVRTEGIITQLVFEHALRVRMKADSDSGEFTAAPTPETASLAGEDGGAAAKTPDMLAEGKTPESQGSNLTGRISTLVTADLGNITAARKFLTLVVQFPIQIALCIWFVYTLLGWSAFVGFVVLIAGMPLPGYLAKSINTVQEEKMKKIDARVQTVTETLNALRMIKLFGWETKIKDQLREKRDAELVWTRKAQIIKILNGNVTFIIPLIQMIATYTTYTLIMHQDLSASLVFSSIAAFDMLRNQLWDMLNEVPTVIQGRVSLNRVNDFLNNTELLDAFSGSEDPLERPLEESSFRHDVIGFRDARFTWSGANPGIMTPSRRQFTLQIDGELTFHRGGLNMVVGPTGSGKTSLLMALLGEMHFSPSTPESAFNLPRECGVAYAAQESWVQNETIKDNILFGAPYEEVRYKKERDLDLFDAGDATEVGERGLTLSGGQKARITLARAIYSSADILLLDDVLAALDVHTSKWIVTKCFAGDLMKGRTTILITHNVALVSPIARFVVSLGLDGRIVSQGTFSDVLATDRNLALEMASELATSKIPEDAVQLEANPKQQEGKLIAAEEIAQGRVGWQAFSDFLTTLSGKHAILFWICFLGNIFLTHILDAFGPWWMGQWAVQYETHRANEISVPYYLSVYAGSLVVDALVFSAAMLTFLYATLRVSRIMHEDLIGSVLGATLRWLDETPVSRVISRTTNDIRAVDEVVTRYFHYVCDLSLSIIVSLAIILIFAPMFIPPSIVVALIGVWVGQVYIRTIMSVKREMSNARSPVLAHFGASVAGLVSIRAFGVESSVKLESMGRINKYTRTARLFHNLNCWLELRIDALGSFFIAGLAIYLVYGDKGTSAGNIGFLLSTASHFNYRLLHWVKCVNEFEISSNSLERIREFVVIKQEPASTVEGRPPAYWPASGDLRVENLSARYSTTGPKVLHDISFHIKSGERIGVVGRTGSGKSSLTLALLRCILTEGNMIYDGLSIQSINLDALRSSITIIPQVPELLTGTLRHNLDPFNQYDDSTLNDGLRSAGLYSLQNASDMVEGNSDITLDSIISNGGGNLSVGQRQILALARAIVRGSKLLILDEATSAIDYETDKVIQASLRNKLSADVTLITVAHRLQTIMDADRIMVLDAGRIVEFASPEELLRNERGHLRALIDESKDRDALLALVKHD